MHKIKIFSIGKTKERWLEEALSEYIKRLTPYASLEFFWEKNNENLIKSASKENNVICLDVEGSLFSSEQFSDFLLKCLEAGGSRLCIIIGGANGLPDILKKSYPLISLSKMTLTHQCTRLILLEQIYRAFEIAKGSKYHK